MNECMCKYWINVIFVTDFLEKVASFSGKSNLNQDNNHTDHNHTQMNGDSKPSETTTNNEYSSDEIEAVKRWISYNKYMVTFCIFT